MEGSLRYQTVGKRETHNSSYTSGQAEKEEIPMKAGRLLERKFRTLSNQRRYCRDRLA